MNTELKAGQPLGALRTNGFDYDLGWPSRLPLPQIYHDGKRLQRRLVVLAQQANTVSHALTEALRNVSVYGGTDATRERYVRELDAVIATLRGEGGFPDETP